MDVGDAAEILGLGSAGREGVVTTGSGKPRRRLGRGWMDSISMLDRAHNVRAYAFSLPIDATQTLHSAEAGVVLFPID